MNYNVKAAAAAILSAAFCLLQASPAAASMVLGYEETGPSTLTGSGSVNSLAVPGAYDYANSFNAPTTTITGSPSPPGYGFYDDFLFSISGATADSITATLDLGKLLAINNLQVRLYNTAGNPSLPVLGTPAGGAIDAWSQPVNYSAGASGTVAVLAPTTLAAGTYVLEIRGNVTGTSGGAYAGVLNLAPVPLPATLPLLLSALGLVGAAAQRRLSS